jgi:hypothetical protein
MCVFRAETDRFFWYSLLCRGENSGLQSSLTWCSSTAVSQLLLTVCIRLCSFYLLNAWAGHLSFSLKKCSSTASNIKLLQLGRRDERQAAHAWITLTLFWPDYPGSPKVQRSSKVQCRRNLKQTVSTTATTQQNPGYTMRQAHKNNRALWS